MSTDNSIHWRRKQWVLLMVAVLLVFIGTLIMTLPARVVHMAPLPNTIKLYGVDGTLWNGQAQQVELMLPNNSIPMVLYDVQWDLSIWQLLTGSAVADVELPELAGAATNLVYGNATVSASSDQLQITNANLSGRVSPLVERFQLPVPLTVDGQWQATIDDYALPFASANGQVLCERLSGNIQARGFAVRIQQEWVDLGNFPVALACESPAVNASLTQTNSLGLEFNATVRATGVQVQGQLQPNGDTPQALRDMLVFLGKPNAQGQYPFQFSITN